MYSLAFHILSAYIDAEKSDNKSSYFRKEGEKCRITSEKREKSKVALEIPLSRIHMFACARKKDMVNKNVLLIIETSFYLENCHFGCGYKRDVLQNKYRVAFFFKLLNLLIKYYSRSVTQAKFSFKTFASSK